MSRSHYNPFAYRSLSFSGYRKRRDDDATEEGPSAIPSVGSKQTSVDQDPSLAPGTALSSTGFGPDDASTTKAKNKTEETLGELVGGDKELSDLRTFGARNFAPAPLKAELKTAGDDLGAAIESDDIRAAYKPLKKLDNTRRQMLGAKVAKPFTPDPIKTAEQPYLTSEAQTAHIGSTAYKTDPKTREAVAQKIAATIDAFGEQGGLRKSRLRPKRPGDAERDASEETAAASQVPAPQQRDPRPKAEKRPDAIDAALEPFAGAGATTADEAQARIAADALSIGDQNSRAESVEKVVKQEARRGERVAEADLGASLTDAQPTAGRPPEPRKIDVEDRLRWGDLGREAFEAFQPEWYSFYGPESRSRTEEILQSDAFAERVQEHLDAVAHLREMSADDKFGRHITEQLQWLNVTNNVERERLRAWIGRRKNGSTDSVYFKQSDWEQYAVDLAVEDLAYEVTTEALMKRDWARLEGAAEEVRDRIADIAETAETGLRGLRAAARADGRYDLLPNGVAIGAMMELSIQAEAELTGETPLEIATRDRAAQLQVQQVADAARETVVAAWRDPATAAGSLGAAAVQAVETTFDQLAKGAARRERENDALLQKLRKQEISYEAYLDGVRANARAATAEALLIADLALAAESGGAALLRRLKRIHFGDLDGPGGAAAVTPNGARMTPPREDPDVSAGEKGAAVQPIRKPKTEPLRSEWEAQKAKAENEFGSFLKEPAKFKKAWFAMSDQAFEDRWIKEPGFKAYIKDKLRRAQGRDSAQAKVARDTHGLGTSGGLHEYFVLDSIPNLRKLGFGPDEIADLEARVPTKGLKMRLHEKSEVFVAHGSGLDRPAHEALTDTILEAADRGDVRIRILDWAREWLPEETKLPSAFYDPQHPFWTGQGR